MGVRVLLWLVRVFVRLVLVMGVVIETAMLWAIVLDCANKRPENVISAAVYAAGESVLERLSRFVAPVELTNGGTFSWIWVAGMALISGAAILTAWLVGSAHDLVLKLYIRAQDIQASDGAEDTMSLLCALVRDPLRAEILYDDTRMNSERERPPLPPSWRG